MFEKLKKKIPNNDPAALLSVLQEEGIEDFRETLFFADWNHEVLEVSRVLHSPNSLSVAELEHFFAQDGLVIVRSLDGDFVAGTWNETYVWTKDLFVPLSESYPLPLIDFLIQYEHGKIASHILPIIR